jgi:hypothetical protein
MLFSRTWKTVDPPLLHVLTQKLWRTLYNNENPMSYYININILNSE